MGMWGRWYSFEIYTIGNKSSNTIDCNKYCVGDSSIYLIYFYGPFCVTVVHVCMQADTVMKQYEQYMSLQHNFCRNQ